MSNKNQNNSISLMQCFDDIFDNVEKACSSLTVATTNALNTTSGADLNCGHYDYHAYDNWWGGRRWNDWSYIWSIPFSYTIETPSYPVSNYSVLEDGTSVIEIAVTGFEIEEISVRREDLKIIVEGKKKEKKEEEKKKYVYKHIAERDFILTYTGSEKWDYEKLTVKMDKGLLTINIPIKEECKPVNTTYEISK